jgi:VIT1/CCC1 family predicted Fe2+/Mn2+ transporter
MGRGGARVPRHRRTQMATGCGRTALVPRAGPTVRRKQTGSDRLSFMDDLRARVKNLRFWNRIPFLAALPEEEASPHQTRANAVLRPIVFGANDGLVSNLALVMGVAGANAAPGVIVLAGVAGLLAGAFSMAVGEYISVQSQRELLDHQLAFERRQIRETPEQEREILARVYRGRGFTADEAAHFVDRVFADPEHAATLLIFEEVGLDARSIGSPVAAAGSSFVAFTIGALVPLIPYLLLAGGTAFGTSLGLSLIALALLGFGISMLTRRSRLYSGVRQVLLGATAAAVTFAVGALIGVQTGG